MLMAISAWATGDGWGAASRDNISAPSSYQHTPSTTSKKHQSLARAVGLTVSYTARASRLEVDVALGPAGADHDPRPWGITVGDRRGRAEALGQGMQGRGADTCGLD